MPYISSSSTIDAKQHDHNVKVRNFIKYTR